MDGRPRSFDELGAYPFSSVPSPRSMQDLYAGWHYTYDAVVEAEHAARLIDLDYLRQTLLHVAEAIDMPVLADPVLHDVVLEGDEEDGVSGVVLGAKGHVTVHTWPLRQRLAVDVFSRVRYGHLEVEKMLRDRFNVKMRSSHWIMRNWP